jgi:hypothetical protein
MADVGAFGLHLHHQDDVTLQIEVGQRGQVVRELVPEDDSQDGHGGVNPAPWTDRDNAARQRSEQNFTFCQSRAHFLRQVKGRQHTAQVFVGRSALRGVRAMRSPRHGLAAPVEKPAAGFRRKLIDDSEQMACRHWGRMNLQPGRREGTG